MKNWFASILDRALTGGSRVLPFLLGSMLLVGPLAAEGVPPVMTGLVEFLLAVTVMFWLSSRLSASDPAPLQVRPLICAAVLGLILVLIQLIPLPVSVVTWLSVQWSQIDLFTWPLVAVPVAYSPLTAVVADTVHHLLRAGLLLGLFLAARDHLRTRDRRRSFLHLLLLAGVLQVLVGLYHRLEGATSIYFVAGWPPGDPHFFGSFVGPNRNAAYLNLIWPIALSIGLEGLLISRRDLSRNKSFERWDPMRSAGQGLLPWTVYLAVAAFLMAGVLACRSRMGWMVMGVGLFAFVPVFMARMGHVRAGILAAFSGLAGGILLGTRYQEELLTQMSRWSDKAPELFRPQLWSAAWAMALDHPLFGTGLGTFARSFGPYNPILTPQSVRYAENAYLEVMGELGIVGLLLVLGCIAFFVGRIFSKRFWERYSGRRAVPGLVIGLFTLGIHAGGDLVLRGYGTSITVGIMCALVIASLEDRTSHGFDPAFRFGDPPLRAVFPILAIPGVWILSFGGALAGWTVDRAEKSFAASEDLDPVILNRVTTLFPWYSGPWLWLGALESRAAQQEWKAMASTPAGQPPSDEQMDRALTLTASAESYLTRALLLSPLSGHPQRLLSQVAEVSGQPDLSLTRARDACRVQRGDYRNWVRLGYCEAQSGNREEALEAYRMGLLRAPESAIDPVMKELFRTALRSPERAARFIPEGGHWRIPYSFGIVLFENGHYSQAVPWFSGVISNPPPSHIPIQDIGWKALEKEDLVVAGKAVACLRRLYPDLVSGLMLGAELAHRTGDLPAALAMLDRAATLEAPGVRFHLQAVEWLQGVGRGAEAAARLDRLRDQNPADSTVIQAVARQQLSQGGRLEALKSLREAIRLDESQEAPRIQMVRLLESIGLKREALSELDACAALAKSPRCRLELARNAVERDKLEVAEKLLDQAVLQDDRLTAAWTLLVEVQVLQGNQEKAIKVLQSALKLHPVSTDVLAWKEQLFSGNTLSVPGAIPE